MKPPLFLKKWIPSHFEHRELVFWFSGFVVFVFLFLQGLIFPTVRKTERLTGEMASMKRRAEQIESVGGSLENRIISLRRELEEMEGNLTQKEKASEVLTSFLKKANDLGIHVLSVEPGAPVLYPDAENPLRLEGKLCQALSFQMNLRCSYRTLGVYLELLEKESPFAFTIDGLDIQKEAGTVSNLKVVLHLTTYLFGSPP